MNKEQFEIANFQSRLRTRIGQAALVYEWVAAPFRASYSKRVEKEAESYFRAGEVKS